MSKLNVVAQNIMDLYYQTYKSEEHFFELYHFKYMASIAYSSFLQLEYEKSYALNKQETGTGFATLNAAWFINEHVKIEKSDEIAEYVACLPVLPFQFKYDQQHHGIKAILPLNGKCKEFIKWSMEQRYKLELLPPSPEVYWFPLGEKVYFDHLFCGMSQAIIIYIPSASCLNDNAVIPDPMEADVVTATLNLMFQAKAGTPVIDVTSDGNPNASLQTEINNLFNKLRGK